MVDATAQFSVEADADNDGNYDGDNDCDEDADDNWVDVQKPVSTFSDDATAASENMIILYRMPIGCI